MKYLSLLLTIAFSSLVIFSSSTCSKKVSETSNKIPAESLKNYNKAYVASGCFWCVEAIYESVEGVVEVISGYSGGEASDANYRDVSNGITDHAEAVEIYYDSSKIDYKTLLIVFFGSHDPTTLNRQGPDAGRQYRSAIFYQNDNEKRQAKEYIKELEENNVFKSAITTEVVALKAFYPAEDYHQDYEKKNPGNPYVKSVSVPRLKKFQSKYPELLKKGTH